MNMADLPPLLTADDMASLLRISRASLYAMRSRGELPGVLYVGHRLRFRRDEVLEWIRRAPPSSGAM